MKSPAKAVSDQATTGHNKKKLGQAPAGTAILKSSKILKIGASLQRWIGEFSKTLVHLHTTTIGQAHINPEPRTSQALH